jgi:hypothetical protein
VGRTLLSDAFDLGVEVAVALAVAVGSVDRTLLSDAFDLGVEVAVALGVAVGSVDQTFLSAAFNFEVEIDFGHGTGPIELFSSNPTQPNPKPVGQECPTHTSIAYTELIYVWGFTKDFLPRNLRLPDERPRLGKSHGHAGA